MSSKLPPKAHRMTHAVQAVCLKQQLFSPMQCSFSGTNAHAFFLLYDGQGHCTPPPPRAFTAKLQLLPFGTLCVRLSPLWAAARRPKVQPAKTECMVVCIACYSARTAKTACSAASWVRPIFCRHRRARTMKPALAASQLQQRAIGAIDMEIDPSQAELFHVSRAISILIIPIRAQNIISKFMSSVSACMHV